MLLIRSLIVVLALSILGLAAAEPALADAERVDALVELFDPNTQIPIENTFQNPASELAEEVQSGAWFSFLLFLPFLILPQVLLLVVIFKFRDRKDGRKPATFIHNNKLEIFWTALPVVVVIIVAIPMTQLVYKMDLPAANADQDGLTVVVIGKQFQWKYEYPQYPGLKVGYADGRQQPVVLQKDRMVTLQFTSEDVNHAWSVPAFGVKKDCFPAPRFNYAWFTPTRTGFFDGQCYELCGEDHGRMVLSAVVAEEADFKAWVNIQSNSLDARDVVELLRKTDDSQLGEDVAALSQAVTDYFADDRSAGRTLALQYWAGYSYNLDVGDQEKILHTSRENERKASAEVEATRIRALATEQRPVLDNLIKTTLSRLGAKPAPAVEPTTSPTVASGQQEG
ncbi:MAG: cytochrome c oxidase subunit II [Planctomycetota bacterium]|jgi:cytochrome c oxidase subunit 2|nr:cytochrome c oxidase subunit II [Planctomycetota bacterium]